MKTLKQIRQRKKEEIHKIFQRRPLHASLEEKEEDECLIEWLQQKQQNNEKRIINCYNKKLIREEYDGLLEELEEKKDVSKLEV